MRLRPVRGVLPRQGGQLAVPGADAGRGQLARFDLAEHRHQPAALRHLARRLPGELLLGGAVEIGPADVLDHDLVASKRVRLHLAVAVGKPMVDGGANRRRLALVGIAIRHDLGGQVVAAGLGRLQRLVEFLAAVARNRLAIVEDVAQLLHDLAGLEPAAANSLGDVDPECHNDLEN